MQCVIVVRRDARKKYGQGKSRWGSGRLDDGSRRMRVADECDPKVAEKPAVAERDGGGI